MNPHISRILIFSLAANVLFAVFVIKMKKENLMQMARSLIVKPDKNAEVNVLISGMNKQRLVSISSYAGDAEFVDSISVLILGNSISLHQILPSVGWHQLGGMAASEIDSDYVHILMNTIAYRNKVKVSFKVINVAPFEREYKTWSFEEIDTLINITPDIVIFQLGENVGFSNQTDTGAFETQYTNLVSRFSKSKRVITLPFFPSRAKNEVITRVALNTNSILVDLSHLPALDERNFAKSERLFENRGVGMHPGNFGMKNIADAIYLGSIAPLDRGFIRINGEQLLDCYSDDSAIK